MLSIIISNNAQRLGAPHRHPGGRGGRREGREGVGETGKEGGRDWGVWEMGRLGGGVGETGREGGEFWGGGEGGPHPVRNHLVTFHLRIDSLGKLAQNQNLAAATCGRNHLGGTT